jgi:hypothetical protein
MPWGGGPPEPLRSCWVPQSRHSRYRLPSGPRRRCQRWSRSLHRQGLAIAASWAMSRSGLYEDNCRSDAEGHRCAAPSLPGRRVWISCPSGSVQRSGASAGRRRRGPGRRGAWTSSHSTSDATVRDAKHASVPLRRVHAGEVRVRSFSTNSRPALRAAASGGRPRPAVPYRQRLSRFSL